VRKGEFRNENHLFLLFASVILVNYKGSCPAIHRVPSPNESNRRGHPKK